MPITVRFSVHARSNRHFNDPRRIWGSAYRTEIRMVPTIVYRQMLGMRADGTYGPTTVPLPGPLQPTPVPVPYQTYVIQGTNTPWDDSRISSNAGITYFPANTNSAGVQLAVSTHMTAFLTRGQAAGSGDINVGGCRVRVSWVPDSAADVNNEGFTIDQMYPH